MFRDIRLFTGPRKRPCQRKRPRSGPARCTVYNFPGEKLMVSVSLCSILLIYVNSPCVYKTLYNSFFMQRKYFYSCFLQSQNCIQGRRFDTYLKEYIGKKSAFYLL